MILHSADFGTKTVKTLVDEIVIIKEQYHVPNLSLKCNLSKCNENIRF